DRDRALLKDQQPAGCRGGAEHGLAGAVSHERKGGKLPLENGHIGNQGRSHVRSSVALAGRHSKTNSNLLVSIISRSHRATSLTIGADLDRNISNLREHIAQGRVSCTVSPQL